MGGFGYTVRNLETNETWISEGAYRIFGLRRLSATAIREHLASLLHPDDLKAMEEGVTAAVKGGEFDLVGRVVRPGGEVRHVHARARRIEGDDSHPPVLLSTLVDVTPAE